MFHRQDSARNRKVPGKLSERFRFVQHFLLRMKGNENKMEDKRVTHSARLVLRLWNVGLFAFVWAFFYNDYAFDTYKIPGLIGSVLVFYIGYNLLCNVYKAFRIASTNIGEIVFSQFLSFAITDFILYVECCLIYNQIVSILPGAGIVVLQLIGTVYIVVFTKRFFVRHVSPQTTLILFGKEKSLEQVNSFEHRLLKKYNHLFHIVYTDKEGIEDEELCRHLQECCTVIMYGVSFETRAAVSEMCIEWKKNFYYTPELLDVFGLGCEPKHLLDTPLMKYEYNYNNKKYQGIKRALDIIFSLFFIILTSPIMLVIAICIKVEDHGPVFFRQKRYTKDARVFEILKFRSMVPDADKYGVLPTTDRDPRITKTGNVIRKLHLDELPQFFNILKGDMSFVGPRPERVEHVKEYVKEIPEFRYRLSVKGGLTGYAQVFGKYNTSAHDKLLLDLMYIENQSILMDIQLVLLTARIVFRPESTEGFDRESQQKMNEITRKNEEQDRNHSD